MRETSKPLSKACAARGGADIAPTGQGPMAPSVEALLQGSLTAHLLPKGLQTGGSTGLGDQPPLKGRPRLKLCLTALLLVPRAANQPQCLCLCLTYPDGLHTAYKLCSATCEHACT